MFAVSPQPCINPGHQTVLTRNPVRGPLRRSNARIAGGFACLAVSLAAVGQTPDPVVRVEEDWQLVVVDPSSDVISPQFHTVLSPYGDLDLLFAQMTWNYRELPDFAAGGFQLQVWQGEFTERIKESGEVTLSREPETITWTQFMETKPNEQLIKFGVENGQSSSWGNFGGDSMTVQYNGNVANLNAYSTADSVANSWVSYGSNRVERLMITEVRRYGPNGLISRDTTQHVVFEFDDGL